MPARHDCKCWEKRDEGLREKFGLKIADSCSALELIKETLDLRGRYGLPLQRVDGAKLKREDAKMLFISHCPFCGQKYTEAES